MAKPAEIALGLPCERGPSAVSVRTVEPDPRAAHIGERVAVDPFARLATWTRAGVGELAQERRGRRLGARGKEARARRRQLLASAPGIVALGLPRTLRRRAVAAHALPAQRRATGRAERGAGAHGAARWAILCIADSCKRYRDVRETGIFRGAAPDPQKNACGQAERYARMSLLLAEDVALRREPLTTAPVRFSLTSSASPVLSRSVWPATPPSR